MPPKTKAGKSTVNKKKNHEEELKNVENDEYKLEDENIATKTTAEMTKSTTKSPA